MKVKNEVFNTMKLTLPALSINESVCRAFTGAFLSCLNPTIEDLCDLKCVVSEAVTNCIVHAYGPGFSGREDQKLIYITMTLFANRTVRITVRDRGVGIPDVEQARQPLFTTGAGDERSGMGFSVMESFTDRMTVHSRPGQGTSVTLIKRVR